MGKDNSGTPLNVRDKFIACGMCLLFGLAFSAAVVFSVVGLATELGGWFNGRTWWPATADIGDISLTCKTVSDLCVVTPA